MTTSVAPPVALRPRPQVCRACGALHAPAPIAVCEQCVGPLDPVFDAARVLPTRDAIAARPWSLWRYREWLPFDGEPVLSLDTGGTPLVEASRLAARLGVARAWVKNDAVSHPSLSFKDRVVATAINAAAAFGLDTIGCASTGNLANAVAAQAARAGLKSWIFIPEDLEIVNLRGYYGEGSKTLAFEIAEQLGWRLPTAVVAPMAGGSLVTKLRKGFREFSAAGLVSGGAPRIFGAQAAGCAPIVRLVRENADAVEPVVPHTIARSIAIGNPADGLFAKRAILESGGWAAAVSDAELVAAIQLLAEEVGIFTETAGGVTVAAALALAAEGRFSADDEVVLCITGNGLKTIDAVAPVLPQAPLIAPRVAEVRALVQASGS